jgi:hypothetical protein
MNSLPCPAKFVDVVIDEAFGSIQRSWFHSIVLSQFTRPGRAIEIENRFTVATDHENVRRPVIGG